jgi:hypothetical protein
MDAVDGDGSDDSVDAGQSGAEGDVFGWEVEQGVYDSSEGVSGSEDECEG